MRAKQMFVYFVFVSFLFVCVSTPKLNCYVSRFSCGSVTPVSSDSSESTPAHEDMQRDHPTALPLDLLTEMEFLFKNERRRDSLPDNAPGSEISLPEKAVSIIILYGKFWR